MKFDNILGNIMNRQTKPRFNFKVPSLGKHIKIGGQGDVKNMAFIPRESSKNQGYHKHQRIFVRPEEILEHPAAIRIKEKFEAIKNKPIFEGGKTYGEIRESEIKFDAESIKSPTPQVEAPKMLFMHPLETYDTDIIRKAEATKLAGQKHMPIDILVTRSPSELKTREIREQKQNEAVRKMIRELENKNKKPSEEKSDKSRRYYVDNSRNAIVTGHASVSSAPSVKVGNTVVSSRAAQLDAARTATYQIAKKQDEAMSTQKLSGTYGTNTPKPSGSSHSGGGVWQSAPVQAVIGVGKAIATPIVTGASKLVGSGVDSFGKIVTTPTAMTTTSRGFQGKFDASNFVKASTTTPFEVKTFVSGKPMLTKTYVANSTTGNLIRTSPVFTSSLTRMPTQPLPPPQPAPIQQVGDVQYGNPWQQGMQRTWAQVNVVQLKK